MARTSCFHGDAGPGHHDLPNVFSLVSWNNMHANVLTLFRWQLAAVLFSPYQISTSHQPVSGIFLSQQISTSHRPQPVEQNGHCYGHTHIQTGAFYLDNSSPEQQDTSRYYSSEQIDN